MHCCAWLVAACHASFPTGHAHLKDLYKYICKGSTLFDAPPASGKRRAMAGTHWPVHVSTDAVLFTHIPPVAGQQCLPLHKAIVHQPLAVPSVPAAVSSEPLTMLFEGHLEQQDPLRLWTLGCLPTSSQRRR